MEIVRGPPGDHPETTSPDFLSKSLVIPSEPPVRFMSNKLEFRIYGWNYQLFSQKSGDHPTQGLIETLGSMVIFDENQAVSDINKYEFLYQIYVKIINFLVI
jgi:hypothetical protein